MLFAIMMESLTSMLPKNMLKLVGKAVNAISASKKPLALSHIDADGIAALAIVVKMLDREGKYPMWENIHQLNTDTALQIKEMAENYKPDLVLFSDLGTGQRHLIEEHISPIKSIENIIILDHHLPNNFQSEKSQSRTSYKIIEINPCQHGLSGSHDLSGAGTAFIVAYIMSEKNIDLVELAIVGASGDLQDRYGHGFTGMNEVFLDMGKKSGIVHVGRDLTFYGINTRPLPLLLEYATDPYLPGITGNRDACYLFFDELDIPLKLENDIWRRWVDLNKEEKQKVVQKLIGIILSSYEDPEIVQGIVGDVITLMKRPEKTELRSAKEFSTVLNACGRNRRPQAGVGICLDDPKAYLEGSELLQRHRTNLSQALHRLENDGYSEMEGMYIVDDPLTPDTIIGIVIGMAQGSRIVPEDKPVLGISTNTTDGGPMVKISGRARNNLIDKGVNLKEAFVSVAELINSKYSTLAVEAGGHPMAAGAFVLNMHLQEFLDLVSSGLAEQLPLSEE